MIIKYTSYKDKPMNNDIEHHQTNNIKKDRIWNFIPAILIFSTLGILGLKQQSKNEHDNAEFILNKIENFIDLILIDKRLTKEKKHSRFWKLRFYSETT